QTSQFLESDDNPMILWGPLNGLTVNGVTISPTTVLDHEADHAVRWITDPKQYDKDGDIKDKAYDNKEEKRVITGREQKTAKALGEIKEGQVTRTNHNKGHITRVFNPTSTKSTAEKNIFNILKDKQDQQNQPQKPIELQHPDDAGPARYKPKEDDKQN
ncbi:MAG: hypothetical protein ABUL46_06470, partial [Chitinophaga rupis]